MDNICHALTGAAFAEAGLKRYTRFGTVSLIVAANLPDIDVLSFVADTPAVALRRGMTHGVLAQALLPVLLAAAVVAIDRWRPPPPGSPRARAGALLLLGYVGVLSHVGMDWLNNYGVRLLMPFSNQWFYGDAVFIIDPWLWVTLAIGVILARRGARPRRAAVALALGAIYIAAMTASAAAARARVAAEWSARNGRPPAALMVGPVPVNPLRKRVIVDAGEHYELGAFAWLPSRLTLDPAPVPKNERHPAAMRAALERDFRALLIWSRFPRYEITPVHGGTRVVLSDMRFNRGIFNAATVVPDGPNP